jgi:hypothetical protein
MPFMKMPGVIGKVYVPERCPDHFKKHGCEECFSCQMCSDDRCSVCRPDRRPANRGGHVRCSGRDDPPEAGVCGQVE